MYKLYVPVMNNSRSPEDLELLAGQLKKAGTDVVFIVFDRVLDSDKMLEDKLVSFKKAKKFFESRDFEVGAWIAPSIGYGGISSADNGAPEKYTHIVTDRGRVLEGAYCPLDDNFKNDFLNTIKKVAETGVGHIMLEDDYTLSGGKTHREHGCFCEKHLKLLRERTGRDLSPEEFGDKLYSGDGIECRHKFLKLMGETLQALTKNIEKTIHSVNPDIRIGLSANASSYRLEGVDFGKLSKLTAGKTKPFIRLTGAPYWEQIPAFAACIEAIRLQAHWLEKSGAELICEGDVYPRPRHWIPSAYLEGYDMILRADGGCGGILKYMTDYTSKADYETGYIDRHIKNLSHYEEIAKRFGGKKSVGLNIIEDTHCFENGDFTDDITRENYHNYGDYQPYISQWFAVDNSLPTAYGQKGCASLAFGENANYINEETLKNGVIIDAYAAKILMKRGIDVGIRAYEKAPHMSVEYFCGEDDYTVATVNPSAVFYDFELKDGAEVLSEFLKIGGGFGNYGEHLWKNAPKCPACYFYENEHGHKFLVYSFVAELAWGKGVWTKGLFRSYYRQAQLCKGIEKLRGKRLPAVCLKNPEVYILCKRDENSMAVGIWNFFADSVINPQIILDDEYAGIDFYNCAGTLKENVVYLDDELAPYSFAFFTVYDKK